MKKGKRIWRRLAGPALAAMVLLGPVAAGLSAADRIRIDIFGGLAYLDPRDLNLLGKAEEQYNYLLFQERLFGYSGYFTNDFPRITKALPVGVRLRYRLGGRLDVSAEIEAFRSVAERSISGTFTMSPSWSLATTKEYSPYRMELKAVSVMAGVHYRLPAGRSTEIEIGAAAGWTRAAFSFRSTWTMAIDLTEGDEVISSSLDGATLEGDGSGDAPTAKLMLRLNRALGRRWGFFVEGAATYCRLTSLSGGGRETRLDIPGETVWEGTWAIKREEVEMHYDSATVLVPTNYWEGWVADQRERGFSLNISSLRLVAGLYVRF